MGGPSIQGLRASGNIKPARFVDLSAAFTVTQASSATTKPPFGISAEYTRYAPGTAWDNGYIATDGQSLRVYQDGEECDLDSGNTAVSAGDLLKTDANGCGIPATTGTYYGARAMTASTGSGKRLRVVVERGYKA